MSARVQLQRQDVRRTALAVALAGMVALSGCTNMSGLGGGSTYACKAPEGVACDSVSGTYANALYNNLPSQRQPQPIETSTTASPSASASASTAPRRTPMAPAPAIATTGAPIQAQGTGPLRSPARVLRLWTKPWEDADGDLYDQGYVYVQVHNGHWLIDHVQRQIRDAYVPLRSPPKAAADAASEAGQGGIPAAEPSPPYRATPADAAVLPRGGSSAAMPQGTSFNRAQ